MIAGWAANARRRFVNATLERSAANAGVPCRPHIVAASVYAMNVPGTPYGMGRGVGCYALILLVRPQFGSKHFR